MIKSLEIRMKLSILKQAIKTIAVLIISIFSILFIKH